MMPNFIGFILPFRDSHYVLGPIWAKTDPVWAGPQNLVKIFPFGNPKKKLLNSSELILSKTYDLTEFMNNFLI